MPLGCSLLMYQSIDMDSHKAHSRSPTAAHKPASGPSLHTTFSTMSSDLKHMELEHTSTTNVTSWAG